jgi:arylsulfatase A-like enzyme
MLALALATAAHAADTPPNIIFIMGDDIGWFNIGAYHQGIMASRTPNLDRLASEGMRFTDYYAEASCTAGRANFATGELPIRTGLTTVGQAGATIGMPAEAPTIATALKAQGYATGQFGKNHFGDLNRFLPTVHGFDEFYGYLYHLDAMEDPCHPNYPQSLRDQVGPRNMLHAWATEKDDPTVEPRWGKVGKQKIEDAGQLCPERMKTVDDEILEKTFAFLDKARKDGKPFFVWLNPTRMHVVTHLSDKYEKMRTPENGWSIEEAGMAQLDDIVGSVLKYLQDNGLDGNTIVAFSTDNGAVYELRRGRSGRGRGPRTSESVGFGQLRRLMGAMPCRRARYSVGVHPAQRRNAFENAARSAYPTLSATAATLRVGFDSIALTTSDSTPSRTSRNVRRSLSSARCSVRSDIARRRATDARSARTPPATRARVTWITRSRTVAGA